MQKILRSTLPSMRARAATAVAATSSSHACPTVASFGRRGLSAAAAAAGGNKKASIVDVELSPSRKERFHGIWLRDSCRCPACFHPVSQQRLLDTKSIPMDIAPIHIEWQLKGENASSSSSSSTSSASATSPASTLSSALSSLGSSSSSSGSSNGHHQSSVAKHQKQQHQQQEQQQVNEEDELRITWPDGHESSYSRGFLQTSAYSHLTSTASRRPGFSRRKTWNRGSWGNLLPRVPFEKVLASPEGVIEMITKLRTSGFVFVDGVPATVEGTAELAQKVGVSRKTLFGDLWDFTSDWKHSDTAYSTLAVEPHCDTTYFEHPAGFQMLHLLHFDGTGGVNTLVDGFRVAEHIRDKHPEAFKTLTTVPLRFQYLDGNNSFQNLTPPIILGDKGEIVEIRYNNTDRAPPTVAFDQMEQVYSAIKIFLSLINDPSFQLEFRLSTGSPVIFDNRRVLHARTSFEGKRRLCGCYWNRDDVVTTLRHHRVMGPMEDW